MNDDVGILYMRWKFFEIDGGRATDAPNFNKIQWLYDTFSGIKGRKHPTYQLHQIKLDHVETCGFFSARNLYEQR